MSFSKPNRRVNSEHFSACRLLLLCFFTLMSHQPLAAQGRQVTLLDSDWRFQKGDPPGAEQAAFNDQDWEHVGLPHSFGTPYFGAPRFYVGYGWYRRHLAVAHLDPADTYALDFDAAFQHAQIYVNGKQVGEHLGGYTGFEIPITGALHRGDNLIAVRLNNVWNAQLNPRAGEHNFNGGIYRDVHLIRTSALHVDWYGTFVTTPGLTANAGPVRIQTDVRNASKRSKHFTLRTVVQDNKGHQVAQMTSSGHADGGQVATLEQQSNVLSPSLWSPSHPTLYTAVSHVLVAGREVDSFRTTFGFRTIQWTATDGLLLNGKRYFFHGADVHQDHAGWGDAVADSAIRRDVLMVKEAGMDFIRGSHYPHSPIFSDACDNEGVLLWEENSFWGTGGPKEEGSWSSSAYPPNTADQAPFERNVERSLEEMIRIHRNHPSIITWSMGNEVFFSDADLMPKVRRFLQRLIDKTHALDPSRPAAIGGVQRGEIDHIGDVAGYNGDGATLFLDPGVANAVTEYGSTVAVRPGEYAPGYGDLLGQPEFSWRGGQALWAAFDHGSIFSTMGEMGMVDYFRIPKRQWYWYRNAYAHVPPPMWPQPGTAAALRLTAIYTPAASPLRADGTDDAQILVSVVDAAGRALSNTPAVTLRIISGPGEFPTGRSITFQQDSDIPIRDGKAAIELHTYQSGAIVLEAKSPGLASSRLQLKAIGGTPFVPGKTPLARDRAYLVPTTLANSVAASELALNRPTRASSYTPGHNSGQADDFDATTYWEPEVGDHAPWLELDFEGQCDLKEIEVLFLAGRSLTFQITVSDGQGNWRQLKTIGETHKILPARTQARRVRLNFPQNSDPRVASVHVLGLPLR